MFSKSFATFIALGATLTSAGWLSNDPSAPQCQERSITGNAPVTLEAMCGTSGAAMGNNLPLAQCIGTNHNGDLTWIFNNNNAGGFDGLCNGCTLSVSGTMTCNCGSFGVKSIDLNEQLYVTSTNGYILCCIDHTHCAPGTSDLAAPGDRPKAKREIAFEG